MKLVKKIKYISVLIILLIVLSINSNVFGVDNRGTYNGYYCLRSHASLTYNLNSTFSMGYWPDSNELKNENLSNAKKLGEALGFAKVFDTSESWGLLIAEACWEFGYNPQYRGYSRSLINLVNKYDSFINDEDYKEVKEIATQYKTLVDTSENKGNIIVGPFKCTYNTTEENIMVSGTTTTIPFNWLENVEILYHDSNTKEWKTLEALITDASGNDKAKYESSGDTKDIKNYKYYINTPTKMEHTGESDEECDYYTATSNLFDKDKSINAPKSGEEFYITYKYEDDKDFDEIKVVLNMKYLSGVYGQGTVRYSTVYTRGSYQELMEGYTDSEYAFKGKVDYKTSSFEVVNAKVDDEMEIAGTVWRDEEADKEQGINGKLDSNDNLLNGIEVYLYECYKDGDQDKLKLATLQKLDGSDLECYSNPQLTRKMINSDTGVEENGRYSFKGLDPTKKYIIKFVYDGMLYTNTYGTNVDIENYNTDDGINSSKGSELVADRASLNEKFCTIGTYSDSYLTTGIFDYNTHLGASSENKNKGYKGYNKIYNIRGEVVQKYKNLIREKLKSYMDSNSEERITSDDDYVRIIYKKIYDDLKNNGATNDELREAKSVMQFIWDCRIPAYAGNEASQDGTTKTRAEIQRYPVYKLVENMVI